ncbi:Cupredoxin [Westerdykella ornata]|uniref:Cupredoxin n=1 Tax=Westerdykella ornata TaxID=318751 RepID=A0A6A6JRF6_WESOR|nr:Cupredoxin [Westerdykella ornata]KAF2278825.1 Cupredoxin [Westerdykella ornata]
MAKQIYPDLPPTVLTTYDGVSPGPIFVMPQGREAVVRFSNKGPYNMAVHVHGQYNRAPFDGWAADYATAGQYKDYYYPNAQNARTAWYHDHTEFATGEHAYKGQEGMYILTDPHEQGLGLPRGQYDVVLAITSKYYNDDASLRYHTDNNQALWGDVIHVNGQPWPYFEVEPRKYRLRLLNGAISRVFHLYFAEDPSSTNKDVQFEVIGSDTGLLSHPVRTDDLLMAMGERYEIVVDFANYAGRNLTLKNKRGMEGGIDYAATDLVMRFVVGDQVTDTSNDGPIPSSLREIRPPPAKGAPDKSFVFERIHDRWLINGVGFRDIENRILARPLRGEDEIWEMTNGRGGTTHPVHIHLVDFQILSRTGGRGVVLPYEAAGMKDVVWLSAGETVRVLARYAPWNGVFLFHCHNLVHEDHDMMVAFNVTDLKRWGYNESTQFIDPMQPEFRPKDINPEDYTEEAIMKKIKWFYDTNAYNHGKVAEVDAALDKSV